MTRGLSSSLDPLAAEELASVHEIFELVHEMQYRRMHTHGCMAYLFPCKARKSNNMTTSAQKGTKRTLLYGDRLWYDDAQRTSILS